MINVNLIKSGDELRGLEVVGHANAAKAGKDLVCAAVSAIVTGGLNAFSDDQISEVILNDGYCKVILSSNKELIILKTIIVQLKTIEERYPKYIKIKE